MERCSLAGYQEGKRTEHRGKRGAFHVIKRHRAQRAEERHGRGHTMRFIGIAVLKVRVVDGPEGGYPPPLANEAQSAEAREKGGEVEDLGEDVDRKSLYVHRGG